MFKCSLNATDTEQANRLNSKAQEQILEGITRVRNWWHSHYTRICQLHKETFPNEKWQWYKMSPFNRGKKQMSLF